MALVRDAEPVVGPSRWLPTHVQVTVLRARGLRGKSSAGSTSDAYTVIQVGREKYSTSVVEKTQGCPEWREECSFELPPGALDGLLRAQEADAGPSPWVTGSAAACELVLTTMHRSLIGVDKFLGQATVALDEVFGAGRAQHTQWYKLHSKTGKKEKERGEIQVTIQFTRNNLSASMFDLSMKDKPRSPFSKLKDKMKGKKKFDLESSSAILPSSALEDPELGSLGKMGKAKGFFLRNKLRKSSLTQSNTSLGSDSTLSSASGSLAYQGPGAELLTRSPSRSSWLSTEGRDSTQSPKLLSHKRTYSDEASQMRVAPPRALLDLQGHLDAASRSSLCVNGSHIYNEEPQAPLRHRSSISGPFPPSSSLPGVSSRPSEEVPPSSEDSWGRGSRGTSSSEVAPGQEDLGTQAKVLATGASHSGDMEGVRHPEGKPVQVATPMVASSEAVVEKEGARKEERKPRMGLFHHHQGLSRSELGRRSSVGEKGGPALGASPHHSSSGEEKTKSSWFGLREAKEPTHKPSASRASPAPLASLGKALPEWDDTFNIFAAGRLHPEARSEILAPEGVGLEAAGLQAPGPRALTVKAAEPQGDPGGGRGGSSMWLEPGAPLDSELDQQNTSASDPGPLGSAGPGLPSSSAQPKLRASTSAPDREPPDPEVGAGQSPADSGTSLFSSPEVISVWERLPGSDDTPEGQDEEAPRGENQLFHELNTDDSWPWDVVTISPATEMASTDLQGESDVLSPPRVQAESPETVILKGSKGPPPLEPEPEEPEPEPEPKPQQEQEEGLRPSTPPPKPPRLFTPSNSQVEEEEEEQEKAAGGLSSWGAGAGGENSTPDALTVGPLETKGEGRKPDSEESDRRSSGTLLGEPGLEELVEDPSPSRSGACPSVPIRCPEGHVPIPCNSLSLALPSQQIAGTLDRGEGSEAQSLGPVGERLGPLSVTPQQADLWASEDALRPFLSQESRDPPSLPSTSPPGSRESSIHSGPEELPTPPEPAFPPPPLPPWASHRHVGPGLLCSPLPGAWPLTSTSPPPGEPASPPHPFEPSLPGGSPAPEGEDHAAATPASPLVLLPLETRPAEELQPRVSPHPVKPLSAVPAEGISDRKQSRSSLSTALSSGLEKLKTVTSGGIQPVAPAPQLGQMVDTKRLKDSAVLDQSAKYYHLTHDELIGLLLQRERELSQRDEHVQELESYIDRLLVRIMETSPTLLQIPHGPPK
ncbi:RAB11 family interacting protein 5, transcript variant X2 [Ictidomys tridecemlineatus]|uniref:rab11 family-interacting protein 5 isoform X2 n=1 Tax=Ictidomys tridecemlineatus TaxID=43179 RepID=UPI000B549203|nr:rab11 family-interacting protein 5 isoform X2 [Ictidomys tridecemlineatus]KAG3267098.1 RAB11 family interacting protein 5, transcript variant X2 [Ictidomys tridecemlineatus]